jgi:hypothetical protein
MSGTEPLRQLLVSPLGVRIWAAGLGLLAVVLGVLNGEVINRDGVLYIRTAQAFLDGGLDAAMQVYNWPAYPIFFALLADWTGLSLEAAAHCVNALLMLLLVDAFIRLSRVLMGENPRLWIPALVVLSFPPFDHRLEIYRDWGYLAFALCAAVPFLKFWSQEKIYTRQAMLWQLCVLAALLFRIEAMALIALAPLGLMFQPRPWSQRIRRFLTANSIMLVVFGLGVIAMAMGKLPVGKLADLALYTDPDLVFNQFTQAAESIGTHALNKYSNDYAPLILGGGIVTLVGWMLLDNMGGFLVLLTAVGLYRYRLPEASAFRPVYWLLAIVVITLSLFLSIRLIPPSRYALLGSLLLLTLTIYAVDAFAGARQSQRRVARYWWWFVVTGLVIGNLANLSFHEDYKSYLREGGQWLAQNVNPGTPLITNDFIIDYYAQRPHGEKIDSLAKVERALKSAKPPFYIALKTNDKDRIEVLTLLGQAPVKEFHSSHAKEAMLIFRRRDMAGD